MSSAVETSNSSFNSRSFYGHLTQTTLVLSVLKVAGLMKQYFLDRQLKKIEREANDEYLQILSFGAQCYATPELQRLLRELDKKVQLHAYYRKIVFIVGASTTLWIAFCFLFQSLDYSFGVYATLAMVPLSIIGFTAGNIVLNKRFRAVRDARLIERIIVEELDRRRKDASIY